MLQTFLLGNENTVFRVLAIDIAIALKSIENIPIIAKAYDVSPHTMSIIGKDHNIDEDWLILIRNIF
jgi:hypothetical protein